MNKDSIENKKPANPTSMVDYQAALNRLGGNVALFKEFIDIFNTDGPVLMDQMAMHIDAGDANAIEKSAHSLKGLMSNFGADTCCQTARQIERLSKEKKLSQLGALHQKLSVEFQSLVNELNGYL